jgi:hypothetical protein
LLFATGFRDAAAAAEDGTVVLDPNPGAAGLTSDLVALAAQELQRPAGASIFSSQGGDAAAPEMLTGDSDGGGGGAGKGGDGDDMYCQCCSRGVFTENFQKGAMLFRARRPGSAVECVQCAERNQTGGLSATTGVARFQRFIICGECFNNRR